MMKLIKIFSILFILLLALFFLLKNTALVSVDLIFQQYENVSVAVVMLVALGVGVVIGYASAVGLFLSAKADIRALNTKNRRVTDELNDLRNVAIDEGIYMVEDEDK